MGNWFYPGPLRHVQFPRARISMKMELMRTVALLILMGFIHPTPVPAQAGRPLVKVYAYLRESTPGIIPGPIPDEKGNLSQAGVPKIRSWIIFTEYRKGTVMEPAAIFINNKRYPVRVEPVQSTPVVFERPGLAFTIETDSLVPATQNPVWKLLPDSSINQVNGTSPVKILVEYRWKGRKYFSREQAVTLLPPLILQ